MRLNQKFNLIAEKEDKKPIDMYKLAIWLGSYNRENGVHLQPSQLKNEHILIYLENREKG